MTCALNCNRYFSGILSIAWQSQELTNSTVHYDIRLTGAIQGSGYATFSTPIIFTYSETSTTIHGWTYISDGNFPQILYLLQNFQGAHIESLDSTTPIYTSSLPDTYGTILNIQTNVKTSNFTGQYTSDDLINENLFN